MNSIQGQLLEMLRTVAVALGDDLRKRLVFVGGCTTAAFITDPVTLEGVRATDDVDLIVDLAGYAAWTRLQHTLRERGFTEAPDDKVICRMRLGELRVDFMPDDPDILGFSNRWYRTGIETAINYALEDGPDIRILTPPLFIATKLEAYYGRGENDLLGSRDAEDILLVVDGREELFDDIQSAPEEVRTYIAAQFRTFMAEAGFDDFLEGNILGPVGRSELVYQRFLKISKPDSEA
ncbi:hypothetical protein [Devosia sp.]|uniref:hypothetical protein n=1 Tax=Devosia sp. TaxID=1871048 RepID=UPI002734AF12|nr:hypothetical protein [Devosia sp.]MDP2778895.1 hypothetical protein [Devosia sp.]